MTQPQHMAALTWEDARWADGPSVCLWLAQNRINPAAYSDTFYRAWFRWGRGGKVDFFTLDKLLCRAGRHVSELPSSVWSDSNKPRRVVVPVCGALRTRFSKGRCQRQVAPGHSRCAMHLEDDCPTELVALREGEGSRVAA